MSTVKRSFLVVPSLISRSVMIVPGKKEGSFVILIR